MSLEYKANTLIQKAGVVVEDFIDFPKTDKATKARLAVLLAAVSFGTVRQHFGFIRSLGFLFAILRTSKRLRNSVALWDTTGEDD